MFKIGYTIIFIVIAWGTTSIFGNKLKIAPQDSNEVFIIIGQSEGIDRSISLLNYLQRLGFRYGTIPSISDLKLSDNSGSVFYAQVDPFKKKSQLIDQLRGQLVSIKVSKGKRAKELQLNILVHNKALELSREDLVDIEASSLYEVGTTYGELVHLHGNPSMVLESLLSNDVNDTKIDDWMYSSEKARPQVAYQTNVGPNSRTPFGVQNVMQTMPASSSVNSYSPRKKFRGGTFAKQKLMQGAGVASQRFSADKTMGFSVGGAMSVANFRERINNNLLPLPGDLTYEGLFSDYYFDTDSDSHCKALFCPSYSVGISPDPLSANEEYYISVGLNSGMKAIDMQRKKLNLVVVLDISGSMGGSFRSNNDEEIALNKMEIANRSLVSLTRQLNDDDRFGVVLFNNNAFLAKPLRLVGDTDMEAIRGHILEINQGGGTNMEDGFMTGASLLEEYIQSNGHEYENRIVFLTDAMPNVGSTGVGPLTEMISSHAERGVYTSFIGVGIDSNSALINHLSNIKGANYHAVNSPEKFKQVLADEFDYMVNPLVFDLTLSVESKGFKVEKVFGASGANIHRGEVLRIPTLFPSATESGETKGGIILLKLKNNGKEKDFKVKVSYKTRNGETKGDVQFVDFSQSLKNSKENYGIKKGILLSRYASLLKHWMADERGRMNHAKPRPRCGVGLGIPVYEDFSKIAFGRRELRVHPLYQTVFSEFSKYFAEEIDELKDESLKQELSILTKLSNRPDILVNRNQND